MLRFLCPQGLDGWPSGGLPMSKWPFLLCLGGGLLTLLGVLTAPPRQVAALHGALAKPRDHEEILVGAYKMALFYSENHPEDKAVEMLCIYMQLASDSVRYALPHYDERRVSYGWGGGAWPHSVYLPWPATEDCGDSN